MMQTNLRKIDVSVISDFHLATMASKANQLLTYLKSIQPQTLILNGDIIDTWRFNRNYFPKEHMKVIRQILKMIENGVEVVYITGNHDDVFRRFKNTQMGNFSIKNQYECIINNKRIWIFHGDVFDHIIHNSPWLAKLGAAAYGWLTFFNWIVNKIFKGLLGHKRLIYKSMKERVIKEKRVLTNFEKAVTNAAMVKNIDMVICGHTHFPIDKLIEKERKTLRYLNCGDWVEHCTAAECIDGNWNLNYFESTGEELIVDDELTIPDRKQIFHSLLEEMKIAALF